MIRSAEIRHQILKHGNSTSFCFWSINFNFEILDSILEIFHAMVPNFVFLCFGIELLLSLSKDSPMLSEVTFQAHQTFNLNSIADLKSLQLLHVFEQRSKLCVSGWTAKRRDWLSRDVWGEWTAIGNNRQKCWKQWCKGHWKINVQWVSVGSYSDQRLVSRPTYRRRSRKLHLFCQRGVN